MQPFRILQNLFRGQALPEDADWWIEITTTYPHCTYYFGPFIDSQEATQACPGYVEDLKAEKAGNIQSQIKRCKPTQLTFCQD